MLKLKFLSHFLIHRSKDVSKNNPPHSLFVRAFSLAEILIVLAIMGILIMLVVPNQAGVASRTKSLEAQQELKMVQNLQYAYFLQFSKYAPDLTTINYIPHKTVLSGGTANYEISIVESTPTGFIAKAEAVQDFDGDGTKNSWEIDQDGVLKELQAD
jgi:type IV pilus assembly protein PilE